MRSLDDGRDGHTAYPNSPGCDDTSVVAQIETLPAEPPVRSSAACASALSALTSGGTAAQLTLRFRAMR